MIPIVPDAPSPMRPPRRRIGLAAPARAYEDDDHIPLAPAPKQYGLLDEPPRTPDRTDH